MSPAQLEIQAVAVVVAVACSLPGVYLVLRRMALMSDAISHSILFGIVLAFFLVRDLASPALIVGAALTGVLTVTLVEFLVKSRLVKADAAIGLVFPLLFSIGVILIGRYTGNVHLDIDSVLLGEIAFAPFNRFDWGGIDLGPKALWVMGVILCITLVFIALFYKELKLATFDAELAASLGFMPAVLHYALMGLVSITAVGAFDAVGSVLVVALMIVPPITAGMLTDRLLAMLLISAGVAAASALSGYWVAHAFDVGIAGSMAVMTGVIFLVVFLVAPHKGQVSQIRRRRSQALRFSARLLSVHLYQHENSPEEARENALHHLEEHFNWRHDFAGKVFRTGRQLGWISSEGDRLHLTEKGRVQAQTAITE